MLSIPMNIMRYCQILRRAGFGRNFLLPAQQLDLLILSEAVKLNRVGQILINDSEAALHQDISRRFACDTI